MNSGLLELARFSAYALRALVILSVFLCSSCAGRPVTGAGSGSAPEKFLGRNGCGAPLTYQAFQHDAFGADWSKVDDLVAFNDQGK